VKRLLSVLRCFMAFIPYKKELIKMKLARQQPPVYCNHSPFGNKTFPYVTTI